MTALFPMDVHQVQQLQHLQQLEQQKEAEYMKMLEVWENMLWQVPQQVFSFSS